MRLLVENSTGFTARGQGRGHDYEDRTDLPCYSVTVRPVGVLLVPGEPAPLPPDLPPYKVPSMKAIRRRPTPLRAVSTFSGAGGSSTGLRMAGIKPLWANEFVEAARDTYLANWPDTPVSSADIRTVTAEQILNELRIERGELDVLEGSPPCASFSTAGKREKGWGKVKDYSDTRQRADDLFFEYARLLRGLQPRAFIAENVSGLVKGVAKGYFKQILAELQDCGYVVRAKVLDAQWLGVPQQRQRLIFVGMRNDLGVQPSFPKPLPYRYPLSAVLDLQPGARVIHDTSGLFGSGDITERPSPTVTVGVNAVNSQHYRVFDPADTTVDPETGENISIRSYAIGREYGKLAPGAISGKYLSMIRCDADRPSFTITAAAGTTGAAGPVHPTVPRKFTLRELRRICGFPDDYKLTGTYKQRWERLGRSVPPVMMAAIAAEVRSTLEALQCAV